MICEQSLSKVLVFLDLKRHAEVVINLMRSFLNFQEITNITPNEITPVKAQKKPREHGCKNASLVLKTVNRNSVKGDFRVFLSHLDLGFEFMGETTDLQTDCKHQ